MAKKAKQSNLALSRIRVRGFKSIQDSGDVELRQLTILAGANSAGKSSPMEALLLLKQTLEERYDPGPLKLDGPIVEFDRFEDMVWSAPGGTADKELAIKLCHSDDEWIEDVFRRGRNGRIAISRCTISDEGAKIATPEGAEFDGQGEEVEDGKRVWRRSKCWVIPYEQHESMKDTVGDSVRTATFMMLFEGALDGMVFVPSERGSRKRRYPASASGMKFPGLFHHYTAGILLDWKDRDDERLARLCDARNRMGLAWRVDASRGNDASVELRVNMRPKAGADGSGDMVNIVDAGRGVSQVLPAITAMFAAEPGRMVHIEEPEIHLHPRAQAAMAELIADAAKRGVQVIIETHSELILLGIQTLVAEGKLDPALVKLHWFERDDTGATRITPADLNENGAFGDWPEDFAKTNLDAQRAYLDAGRPSF
ncbi:MAG: AAA family ATPase [Planctomycetota bacterium]|jgi:hypothetical protein